MPLFDIAARYDAAASATIEHHQVKWPAMSSALGALRGLRKQASIVGASGTLDDILDDTGSWIAGLMASPSLDLAARAAAETIVDRVLVVIKRGSDSAAGHELAKLHEALVSLAGSPHPGAVRLEDIISRYGRAVSDDPPAVYVAGCYRGRHLLSAWLEAEELDAQVCKVGELRRAEVRDALVLIGPPARYFTSAWCAPSRAARVSGWLLTAPPARHVHVVTWPGHGRFTTADAPLFGTTPPPRCIERGTPADPSTQQAADEPVWLPPAVDPTIRKRLEWQGDRDPVNAVGLKLAGDGVAFFPVSKGEVAPELVEWDAHTVSVSMTASRRLRPGMVLVFRPHRVGDDPELRSRADELLATRTSPAEVEQAHECKRALKEALQKGLRQWSMEELEDALTNKLNNRSYARHILRRIPDSSYIAPERPGAYDATRLVLRMGPDSNGHCYRLLRLLRADTRKAGHEINGDLMDALRSSTAWQEQIEAQGFAEVALEGMGSLRLRAVAAVDPQQHQVARSRLGRLLLDESRGPDA